MENGQAKESVKSPKVIDIDAFLQDHEACRLGTSPEDDSQAGFFRKDSRVFASLGSALGSKFSPEDYCSRTVYFDKTGQAIVIESLDSLPCEPECILGREAVGGGNAASRIHAKVLVDGDHYYLEDLESTNGTIVFKPESVDVNGLEKECSGHVAAITLDENFINAFISFGEISVVKFSKHPSGSFILMDATASRKSQARRFYFLEEGEAITVGGRIGVFPEHLAGERLSLRDEGIERAHLRFFVKDGNLFILNFSGKPFEVIAEGLKPKVRPEKAPTPPIVEKPSRRVSTAKLWQLLEREIDKMKQKESNAQKIYRQLAREHHPDFNLDDPNANRRMQLINKYFGR